MKYLLMLMMLLSLILFGNTYAQNNFPPLSYTLSLQAGMKDSNGMQITGTEIMQLVPFNGKLYAGNDLWMENDPRTPKAAQILVLSSPHDRWKVDYQFSEANLRMVAMKAITFTTDGMGSKMDPVSLLLAAPDVTPRNMIRIYSHNDKDENWIPMDLGFALKYSTTRAIGFHHDSQTGVDLVFAGNNTMGIIHGSYDNSVPGKIKWTQSPELAVPEDERVMGFCECNGKLYCATTKSIFERTDGTSSSWKRIFYSPQEISPVGLRGLSSVPNPAGKGEALLFISFNKVHRLDPSDLRDAVELNMASYLSDIWGRKVGFVLAAYNDFYPYTIPKTGEKVWLFGFETTYPRELIRENPEWGKYTFENRHDRVYYDSRAYFFIRHVKNGKTSYEVAEIDNPRNLKLVAVRTIAVSPFPGEEDSLYFGGFDCNSQPSHNTAWIFRGKIANEH